MAASEIINTEADITNGPEMFIKHTQMFLLHQGNNKTLKRYLILLHPPPTCCKLMEMVSFLFKCLGLIKHMCYID